MVGGMWADRDTPGVGSSGLKPSRAIVACVVFETGERPTGPCVGIGIVIGLCGGDIFIEAEVVI